MKNTFLSLGLVAACVAGLTITSCKKEDKTAPVITLTGDAEVNSVLNAAYTDGGATAKDDEDGDLTAKITVVSTVNKDLSGTYTVTYNVSDAAGNAAAAVVRTVKVKNDLDAMTGSYTCTIAGTPNYVYTQTVTASTTLNKRLLFGKFGDYTGNTGIYADVNASTITLPSQTAVSVGSPATTRTFAGTGAITSTGFGLTYTETTSGGTDNTVETFVKQ